MKKVFFISIVLFLMNVNLLSQSVDVQTAKSLGTLFLKNNTNLRNIDLELEYTSSTHKGETAFYVFTNKGKGFVIVSADDRMRPILGYSDDNIFNSKNINPGLNTFFCNYVSTYEYVVDNDLERSDAAKKDWECLKNTGKLSFNRTDNFVKPLVTTTWNQSDLYNSMCPEDPAGYGGHVKSGCVANAMAQIMNYWEWPQVGQETHYYYSDYGLLQVDFEETQYQYEFMPEFLDYTSHQVEIDAVALLQYHAGVSVNMMYGPTASGAYSDYVQYSLNAFFRYSSDIEMRYYVEDVWEGDLSWSLYNGEPLYYSAYGPDGGHAFVCCGYDENMLFYFNWGWQGFDNGYYAIDNFYLTYYDFPYGHEAIFNIRPNDEYYQQPKPIENVVIEVNDETLLNTISFDAPTQKLNDDTLSKIDSIIVLCNTEHLFTFDNPTPGETLSYEDQLDKNGVNYYCIYPMFNGLKGKAVIDTIMTGPVCELRFNLYDSDDDGWLSPSISVLDSRGIVVKRIGLEHGSFDTITVSVPDNDTLTFFWNYVNAAYSDEDDECSFEIYDKDIMIYQSEGKPQVGEFFNYYVDCEHINVAENNPDNKIVIYPNPVGDNIYFYGHEIKNIVIYNALGQEICNETITDNKFNVSFLKEGLYLVKLLDEDSNVVVRRFVKK